MTMQKQILRLSPTAFAEARRHYLDAEASGLSATECSMMALKAVGVEPVAGMETVLLVDDTTSGVGVAGASPVIADDGHSPPIARSRPRPPVGD